MSQKVERSEQAGVVGLRSGLDALRESSTFRGPVEPLDEHEHSNDHLALIYESREEQFNAAVPFVRQGLEDGEKCLYIADENTRTEVLDAMAARGVDVDAALESGALSVLSKQDTYLRNGNFHPDDMISFLEAAIADATEEYEALRVTGEMTWVVGDDPDVADLIEYEGKLNRLFPGADAVALCQYNRERFPPEVIRDVVRTHPHLIYDDAVLHNAYYTPPEEFFGPERPANEVDRMLGTLRDRSAAKAELEDSERYLRESYEITSDPTLSFEEKLERLLDLARERLGLDAAGLTHLPETDGEVLNEFAIGYGGGGDGVVDAPDGVWTDPVEGQYCRAVVESDTPVGKADVRGTDWEDDPIYQEHGLTSYIGTRVTSGSTPYGSLWVGSTEPRDRPFSAAERTFLDLVGQWVSYEIDQREHRRDQRELYEITADTSLATDEKIDRLLDVGRERLDLPVGMLTRGGLRDRPHGRHPPRPR